MSISENIREPRKEWTCLTINVSVVQSFVCNQSKHKHYTFFNRAILFGLRDLYKIRIVAREVKLWKYRLLFRPPPLTTTRQLCQGLVLISHNYCCKPSVWTNFEIGRGLRLDSVRNNGEVSIPAPVENTVQPINRLTDFNEFGTTVAGWRLLVDCRGG